MPDFRDELVLDRSKEKLKKELEEQITIFFGGILDLGEIAIGDPQRYKPFRAKVLRAGNDTIRELKKLLDRNYEVVFVPTTEDVIEIQPPAVEVRKPINQ